MLYVFFPATVSHLNKGADRIVVRNIDPLLRDVGHHKGLRNIAAKVGEYVVNLDFFALRHPPEAVEGARQPRRRVNNSAAVYRGDNFNLGRLGRQLKSPVSIKPCGFWVKYCNSCTEPSSRAVFPLWSRCVLQNIRLPARKRHKQHGGGNPRAGALVEAV